MPRADGWLELRYDDAIRVMARRPHAAAAMAGSPLGDPATGLLRLQGTGIASASCSDPDCVRGVPPVQRPPEQVAFWMELSDTATIEPLDGGPSCLIVPGTSASIAIPIFDAAPGAEWIEGEMEGALTKYREQIKTAEPVAFHVYQIALARDPLAALQNKRIVLPVPCELVKADRLERIRSTG